MNRHSGRLRKFVRAVPLLVLATLAFWTANRVRPPSGPDRSIARAMDFLHALRIYSGFSSGLDAEEIRNRYLIEVNVRTEAEALEQVIALQSDHKNIGKGAAPEGTWRQENSGFTPKDRGELNASVLSHRKGAFSSISSPRSRMRSFGFLLWEEPQLLTCERCWLTPSCSMAHGRWASTLGRSPFQREEDRRALRQICRSQADWFISEIERTGWGGDYLADFSICRKTLEPESPPLCTQMPSVALSAPELYLHPSCLDDAQEDSVFQLKRARFDHLHGAAESILTACPLQETAASRPILEALPHARYGGSFILLTCFDGFGRITDGQRGLIQFDDSLLAEARPDHFEYIRRETYEEPASWPFSGMRTLTREITVKTNDPKEIREHRATITPVPQIQFRPTRAEAEAITAYVSLLTIDALRNQPARFRVRDPIEVPQATAETLGRIWMLDCLKRRSSGEAFYEAALRIPEAASALDACKAGTLPTLPDRRQNGAIQQACERLKAPPPPPPRSSEAEDEEDDETAENP